ncbi:uncharacterized protein LOC119901633 [Micropterus salmoides]|uniref:uncharacterized protein LOC119901633 n=1 Tax=Micropterus salmoides TaxID=27706 RepID=UPI0018EC3771|nr:uncharacterized protein LOC119901633 [Micropterus salmoides]
MKGFMLEVKSCCVLSIVHSVQVEMMQLCLVWMIIFMFHTGSSEDLVKPFKDVMLALEGDSVTLSCNYSGSVQNLYWYQQKSSSSPQFFLAEYSKKPGFSFKHDKTAKEFHLQISSAAVTDSAVYANVGDYFFWYRQYPGKPPGLLISHSASGAVGNDPIPGLSVKVSDDKTHLDLQISSAAVTDSAVYYCAVKPTVTGNTKTLFKNLTAPLKIYSLQLLL